MVLRCFAGLLGALFGRPKQQSDPDDGPEPPEAPQPLLQPPPGDGAPAVATAGCGGADCLPSQPQSSSPAELLFRGEADGGGGRRAFRGATAAREAAAGAPCDASRPPTAVSGMLSDAVGTSGRWSSARSMGSSGLGPVSAAVPADGMASVTQVSLEEFIQDASSSIKPWDPGDFMHVKTRQDALHNHTHVDHMLQSLEGSMRAVAVKRLPNAWMKAGPQEFLAHQPRAAERPWCDLGILRYLNSIRFPWACDLLGVFRDEEHTYAITSLATNGNLFAWSECKPDPGPSREAIMLPIVRQVFAAIASLHELGLAHRDVSLENILLTQGADGELQVRIIDFAMATSARECCMEVRGKPSYQAPEMHLETCYDPFLADAFSLGVTLFAMALRDYPWSSTKPGVCPLFGYVRMSGFKSFLQNRRLRPEIGNDYLVAVLSPSFTALLEGLLFLEPYQRLTLGEPCLAEATERRASVWDMEWLR